jgi:glycosyltransferase involved in cell wall biosynthesis
MLDKACPKISIIVPVYKVEKYLDRCVQSIVDQTYINWELLLIDDGSPDRSGEMCDEWKKRDNRIRVFHGPNCGVSVARNTGLDEASGEWIMFVDSDDWIAKDCLKICIEAAQKDNLDIVQFNFAMVDDNVNEQSAQQNCTEVMSRKDYIEHDVFNVCVWGSILHRTIIENNNLRFPVGIKLGEDQIFMMQVIRHARKVRMIRDELYYYMTNYSSATHNARSSDMVSSIQSFMDFKASYPEFTSRCDVLIMHFMPLIIVNDDVDTKQIVTLYKKANLKYDSAKDIRAQLFYKVSRVNIRVAIYVLKFAHKIHLGRYWS